MTEYANRMQGLSGSAIREIFKLVANPNIIAFAGGNPAKESFPYAAVQDITATLLEEKAPELLQYGITEGYRPLREACVAKLMKRRGFDAKLEETLIVSGSTQSMDIITKVFVNPGDTILVESPTFLGALQIFRLYQANLVAVDMDDEGVIMDDLEEKMRKYKPKLFYCIPTFQNPTGKTLGAERRRKIAELAAKYDVMVIEDDPYCDLRYRGEMQPCIKSFDSENRVILLNSFSKILSPGIRVGCIYTTPELIAKLTIAKQGSDTHTANLCQALAAEFLNRDMLDNHLTQINKMYDERFSAMLDAMKKYFPGNCKYTKPDGGLFIWCEMPKGVEMLPIFKRSVEEKNVAFVPGEHFFVNPEDGKNTMRLNFSAEPVEKIYTGIEKLGELLKEYC